MWKKVREKVRILRSLKYKIRWYLGIEKGMEIYILNVYWCVIGMYF